MRKHKLIELRKIVEEGIGALTEEVEIATNVIKFENILKKRIEELNIKLKESNNLRESDILINEIDTLDSVLGRLFDLKYGEHGRAVEIAEADNDFKRAIRLRKQLNKMQDLEDEISVQIQKQCRNKY
jgi:hypothetical protein